MPFQCRRKEDHQGRPLSRHGGSGHGGTPAPDGDRHVFETRTGEDFVELRLSRSEGGRRRARRVSSSMPRKERTVLGPSTFFRASGIPKLEADDRMELRLLWHFLELGAPAVR